MSVALAWSRSTTPACIADLPDELLEAVLLFLGQRDRYLAAAVSRRFAVASYSPNCWKSLQLHVGYTHVRANELPVVTPENAPALLQQPRFSQLQELSIVAVGRGVKLASLLAAAPPSVERLKISYLESVEPSPAASQQPGGPGPGALDLEGVSLRALPALRALSLRFLDPGSPPGEARFVYAAEALAAAGPAPRLEELALDAPLVAVGEGAPFAPLRAAFPALRTLRAACVSWGGPGPLRALLEAGLVPERLVLHRVHDEACAADAPLARLAAAGCRAVALWPACAAAAECLGDALAGALELDAALVTPRRARPERAAALLDWLARGAHAASLERLRLGEGALLAGGPGPLLAALAALPRLRALSFAPEAPAPAGEVARSREEAAAWEELARLLPAACPALAPAALHLPTPEATAAARAALAARPRPALGPAPPACAAAPA